MVDQFFVVLSLFCLVACQPFCSRPGRLNTSLCLLNRTVKIKRIRCGEIAAVELWNRKALCDFDTIQQQQESVKYFSAIVMLKIPDSVNRIMSRVPPHSVGLNLFFSTMFLTMGLSRQRQLKVTHQVPVGEEAIRQHWIAKDGEHNFLKDVLGDEALGWVKQRNEHSIAQLGDPSESPLYDKVLSILDSSDKIPYLKKINDLYYNFWQDKANPRGLWRRISLDSYLSTSPNWEVVIDFDELGRAEGESWVYKGHTLYEPSPSSPHQYKGKKEVERAMMHLSRGGADAVVLREFDLVKKAFVEQDPFYVPEAKSSVVWKTRDILLVGRFYPC